MYFGIGYPLGQLADSSKPQPVYAKWSNLNNHVGFKGTTRVGKTQVMLTQIDQCIAKGWDVIVVDPKGSEDQEVLSSVIESCYIHGRSQDFNYFSLAYPSLSEYVNPLYGKSNASIAADIITSIQEPGMETFYLEIGTRILLSITTAFEYLEHCTDPTGVITKKLEHDELEKYNSYMNKKKQTVQEDQQILVQNTSDVIDKMYSKRDSLLKTYINHGFNRTLITFKDLEAFSSYDDLAKLLFLVKTVPVNPGPLHSKEKLERQRDDAIRLLSSALKSDKAHFSKVSDTLANRLIQLSVGPVGEVLCGIRINPLLNRLLRPDKGNVTVVQPTPMKFKNASMVFVKMLLSMIQSIVGTVGASGKGLDKRIALFLDEGATIAYPGIEDFFNKAGMSATVFIYTQADEDYENATSKPIAAMIEGNINTVGTMRMKGDAGKEKAAKSIGTIQKHRTLAMVSNGGADGRYTTDTVEEYICKPDDIGMLPVGEGILSHDGRLYYMRFPFRAKPKLRITMPEIEGEESISELIRFEKQLEEEENDRQNQNAS